MNALNWVECPTCQGDGYLGDPEMFTGRNCRRCRGRGELFLWELDEDELEELEADEEDTDE